MAKYSSRTKVSTKKRKTWKKVVMILAYTCAAVLAVSAGLGFAVYKNLNDSVKSEDFTGYLDEDRAVTMDDPLDGRALNYVLIGSDSRANGNSNLGGGSADDGQRSDTTIIAHVSEDRSRVDLISIPRDSIVDIPSCKLSTGAETKAQNNVQFNWAFSKGDNTASAVACTISTIEENTGLYIDGYAVVDFVGFESMVDAIGGVKFNVPEDMVSKKADLNLQAGEQTLNGHDALAYARARTFEVGGGDGSDIQRIERQQELLKAFADQLLTAQTLTNPTKTYAVTESVLDSLTVSPELGNVNSMASFGYSLRNISTDDINFYTIPTKAWSQDKNRVIWTDEAENYWQALIDDEPVTTDNSNSNASDDGQE